MKVNAALELTMNTITLHPPSLSEVLLRSIDLPEPQDWWPEYLSPELKAQVVRIVSKRELQNVVHLLGREVYGRMWKSLPPADEVFRMCLARAIISRDRRVVEKSTTGGRWFTTARPVTLWKESDVQYVTVWAGHPRAAVVGMLDLPVLDAGLSAIQAREELIERLKPPPTAVELAAAAEERRHQEQRADAERIFNEAKRAAETAEAWRREQREEWKRRREQFQPTPSGPPVPKKEPSKTERKRPKPSGSDTSKPVSRRGYRQEVQAWMQPRGLTNAQAARKLGVGVSTLKSIMSSKGKLRCSDDTLNGVLQKIGSLKP